MQSFKDLIVWQKAMDLAKLVYQLTESLPKNEEFGLKSQMRRAAVSIPSNIAEGRKRGTRKDFTQFLRIADGSLAELETQLLLSEDLYEIKHDHLIESLQEVGRMLSGLISKLKADT
ncbi:four helix bundle protein [Candidatus Uhrbacteria bacterium]|nr:MAG: four helix bundle protein [Candidatus Uhrbacteria bacterium]